MFLAQHVAAIDRLLAGPAPRWTDLRVGEGFWEDDGTARREAEEAFAADCEALSGVLSARWGEPEVLDLTGHLVQVTEGERVPEPLRTLCGYVRVLHRWRLGGRWLGLGTGRQGGDLPLQLVAAVGEEESGVSPDRPERSVAAARTPRPWPPGSSAH